MVAEHPQVHKDATYWMATMRVTQMCIQSDGLLEQNNALSPI